MNTDHFRQFFPLTKDQVYLNHAAISPYSTRVTAALEEYAAIRSSGSIEVYPKSIERKEQLKINLGKLINASPRQIAIATSTSEGLNWLANGLDWKAGDRILIPDYEFPSNVYPFLNLKRFGVEIDFIPNRDGKILIEDIEKRITPRTRVLTISFVEFLNGFRNDLAAIGKLCKQHGVIFSVDAIQGLGAIPFDVQAMQIDFVASGGHKWLMSPMGCGFFYVAPHLHRQLTPVFAGWLGVKDAWNFLDYNLDLLEDAERYEIGTANFLGMFGGAAATGLLLEAGPENTEQHLLALGDRLIGGLSEMGMQYIGSDQRNQRSGIYSFKAGDVENLISELQSKKIHVVGRNGAMRVAPHFYNNEDDIDQLILECKHFYQR